MVICCMPGVLSNETIEICWEEYLLWNDLTPRMKEMWTVLGQTAQTWAADVDPNYDCWDDMTTAEVRCVV